MSHCSTPASPPSPLTPQAAHVLPTPHPAVKTGERLRHARYHVTSATPRRSQARLLYPCQTSNSGLVYCPVKCFPTGASTLPPCTQHVGHAHLTYCLTWTCSQSTPQPSAPPSGNPAAASLSLFPCLVHLPAALGAVVPDPDQGPCPPAAGHRAHLAPAPADPQTRPAVQSRGRFDRRGAGVHPQNRVGEGDLSPGSRLAQGPALLWAPWVACRPVAPQPLARARVPAR